jgi:hypothetical protein
LVTPLLLEYRLTENLHNGYTTIPRDTFV